MKERGGKTKIKNKIFASDGVESSPSSHSFREIIAC